MDFRVPKESFRNLISEFGDGMRYLSPPGAEFYRPTVKKGQNIIEFSYAPKDNIIGIFMIYPETEELMGRKDHIASILITDKVFQITENEDSITSVVERNEIYEKVRKHLAPWTEENPIPLET